MDVPDKVKKMCVSPIRLKVTLKQPLVDREKMSIQVYDSLEVPCGKCVECAKAYSSEWALRICLEAAQYKENCCLTLTYNNEHLPADNQLCRRDIQLFIKRLRKSLYPQKIRYFYAGEYGSLRGRPHYHCIVFNYFPKDALPFYEKNGNQFYKSEALAKLWDKGFVDVGQVDYRTAFYCAKYLQKVGKWKDFVVQPFVGMSLKPSIGLHAIDGDDLARGCLYFNGQKYALPRSFIRSLERQGVDLTALKLKRREHIEFMQSLETYQSWAASIQSRRKKSDEFLKTP
ncbi:replication initiator protein [Microvirus mar18]|uniref:Replication initiator protein n=1 Tax=Microvirus mar18 TaxID=2851150 RepID=A0A8F5MIS9_9VIRU|nr:replication initiator protein [Microvirus mar18]